MKKFNADKADESIVLKLAAEKGSYFCTFWSGQAPGMHGDMWGFFLLFKFFSMCVRDFWVGVNECRLRWD